MIASTNTYTKNNLVLYTNPNYKDAKQIDNKSNIYAPLTVNIDSYEDIEFSEIKSLAHVSFLDEKIYVCDMLGRSHYEYLEYLEISHSIAETLLVNVEVNFRLSEWKHSLNLLNFVASLRCCIDDKHGIHSEQENLFDEDLIHIKFQILATEQSNLAFIVQRFSQKISFIHHDILARSVESKVS